MSEEESIIREKPKKKNNIQRKMIVFLVIVIGILIAVPAYFLSSGLKEEEFELRSYQYAEVDTRTFTRTVEESGTVSARNPIGIESEVEGEVSEIYVESGEEVEQGQQLIDMEVSSLKEEIKEKEGQITDLEIQLEEMELNHEITEDNNKLEVDELKEEIARAEDDLRVQKELYDRGMVARKEFNQTQNKLQKVRKNLENRQKKIKIEEKKKKNELEKQKQLLVEEKKHLEELKEKEKRAEIKAPISGRVLNVRVEEEDSIQDESLVVEMADMSDVQIDFYISEKDIDKISEDQEAEVTVAGEVVKGRVSYISSTIDKENGIEVHTVLEEIPQDLRNNASAQVKFEVEKRDDIPYLPRGNYLTSGSHSFVYMIEDDQAYRTDVTYGQHDGNYIEVTSGLEKGDQIITSTYEDFKDKRKINLVTEGGRKLN
ncbi:MAG: efflux RND transporter periplasmic adaptor subunit [Halanaerobiaceae bacterium]